MQAAGVDVKIKVGGAPLDAYVARVRAAREYNFERILAERLQPRDGQIALPQRPGLGLVLDEAAIARFTVP